MKVDRIPSKLAAEVVVENHYLHRRPPISFAFGLFSDLGKLVGVCTFGNPPSRHLQVGVCPDRPDLVTELNRLWVSDDQPRNTETYFVARCLAELPARIVVSYADTSVGHVGYVYRAGNWNYAGLTDSDRKTPRYDYVPANGKHSRDAFRSGDYTRIRRLPKHRYWIVTGNRTERKHLEKRCGWKKLSWKVEDFMK